jgi:hypothetical protein
MHVALQTTQGGFAGDRGTDRRYTRLALPHVLRTGDQIDMAIVPFHAMAQRGVALNDSILLLQGISVGVEF